MAGVRRKGKKDRKWGRNKRKPSFVRYWANGGKRLKLRKVRNLVRCNGLTVEQAKRKVFGE